jgi:hypothetical protein
MNYFSTTGIIPRMAWCAVYDSATGEVVHVHSFIGNQIAADNEHAAAMRAEAALDHVKGDRKGKTLQVSHGDPKKPPGVGDRLTYDLKKKKLVATRGLMNVNDVAKQAAPKVEKPKRAAKEPGPKAR